MSVCLAKIGIVIDDRFPFLGVLQKFYHTSPQDRVQGIIRAKHENIVFLDLRQGAPPAVAPGNPCRRYN